MDNSTFVLDFKSPSKSSPFEFFNYKSYQDYEFIHIQNPYVAYTYHQGELLVLPSGNYRVKDISPDDSMGLCAYDSRRTMNGHLGFLSLELQNVESEKLYLNCWGVLEIKFTEPKTILASVTQNSHSLYWPDTIVKEYVAALSKLIIQPLSIMICQQLAGLKEDNEVVVIFREISTLHLKNGFQEYGIELIRWEVNNCRLLNQANWSKQDDHISPSHRITPYVCNSNDTPLIVMQNEHKTYHDIYFG